MALSSRVLKQPVSWSLVLAIQFNHDLSLCVFSFFNIRNLVFGKPPLKQLWTSPCELSKSVSRAFCSAVTKTTDQVLL